MSLELVLSQPIEKLVPMLIQWNNTELLEAVEQALRQYEGLEYTDEQIAAAKSDRAVLNAFVKSLNDERIRIGKVYAAPYEKFKSEVDEVVGRVKTVVAQIDTQVKAHELAAQQKKQATIREYFDSVIGEFAVLIPYEKAHQSRWLNASTSMKSIRADIDKLIADARQAMTAIEALNSQDEEVEGVLLQNPQPQRRADGKRQTPAGARQNRRAERSEGGRSESSRRSSGTDGNRSSDSESTRSRICGRASAHSYGLPCGSYPRPAQEAQSVPR